MQVKKQDVTSVSGPDGEIVADADGILTVPTDLGEWLVRVHGFEQFIAAPEAEKPETATQKKKREAAEAKKPEAEKPETAADSPEGDSQD